MHVDLRSTELSASDFDYPTAFSRNIGWITEWEQQELRKKTVAIAGMGGVGGAHAVTLARLGIGGFHIADLDRFDVVNLNRQAGAFMSTVNLKKTAVMAQMIRDINPGLRLKVFDRGVDDDNLDEFLTGVDLFVDGFDFFAMGIRRKAFKRCAEIGLPAITAAPIGFGSSYLIFMPGGMSFEEYFRLEGLPEERQYVNFAVGLAPKGFHRRYLVDPSRLDLVHHRGPSTAAAIQLCAGIVGAETIKILLGRGKVHAAPAHHQFDAYRGQWKRGYLRYGNVGPLQSLKRYVGYRAFATLSRNSRPAEPPAQGSEIRRILDLARWAPSGDNAQPWRFEIAEDDKVIVHVLAEGEERNLYDYANGQPTLMAGGFLLETMRVAASGFGRTMQWIYRGSENLGSMGTRHTIEVALRKDATIHEDPLYPYITIRSVNRRAYRRRRLTLQQKSELEVTLGGELRVEWRETLAERWRLACLNARSTDIRLRLPEAYRVHKRILDWKRKFSPDGVPAVAVGLDSLTLRFMHFVLDDWRRVDFMNRFLAGTAIPQLQLDLIPGVCCSAYFVVTRKAEPTRETTPTSLLRTGEHLQRFWLTATRIGLALQPTLAPLCFAYYSRVRASISARPMVTRFGSKAAGSFPNDGSVLFLGRIGTPRQRVSSGRSTRRHLADLVN